MKFTFKNIYRFIEKSKSQEVLMCLEQKRPISNKNPVFFRRLDQPVYQDHADVKEERGRKDSG